MPRVRAFLRLWAMLLVAYASARLTVHYYLRWSFDLRPVTGLEYALVSLGQAIVYWLVAGSRPVEPPPA